MSFRSKLRLLRRTVIAVFVVLTRRLFYGPLVKDWPLKFEIVMYIMFLDRTKGSNEEFSRNISRIRRKSENGLIFLNPLPNYVTIKPVAIADKTWEAEWLTGKNKTVGNRRGLKFEIKVKAKLIFFFSQPIFLGQPIYSSKTLQISVGHSPKNFYWKSPLFTMAHAKSNFFFGHFSNKLLFFFRSPKIRNCSRNGNR